MKSIKYFENLEDEAFSLWRKIYTELMNFPYGKSKHQRLRNIEIRANKRLARRSQLIKKHYYFEEDESLPVELRR